MTTDSPSPAVPSPAVPSIRFATHHHTRLAYELIPSPSPSLPPFPPLVLLHSLLPGRAEFTPLRDLLTGHIRLILPDARGHGASAALPDQRYTIAIAAAELGAILDHAGETHVHLLGHDIGATVALAFTLAHPARVASLTLIDPALSSILAADPDPVSSSAHAEAHRAGTLAAGTAYKGVTDRALDQYLSPRLGPNWRETTPKLTLATIRRHSSALAGILPALNTYTLDPATVATLSTPTHIVTTAPPRPVTAFTSDRLANLIPNAHRTHLPPADPQNPAANPLSAAAAVALANLLQPQLTNNQQPSTNHP